MAIRSVRIPAFRSEPAQPAPVGDHRQLQAWFDQHRRIMVLTGAGCSTGSGIPAYRDGEGQWRRRQPIFYQDFMRDEAVRKRYWARSFFGWPLIQRARPNTAHYALARLQRKGRISGLITQNVDGLHQAAGHQDVIELHGGLARVQCTECGAEVDRNQLQSRLDRLNPGCTAQVHGINPDGDAELDDRAGHAFQIADCDQCGGILKPDVVFFGESVPVAVTDAAIGLLDQSDAVLVVGSSLVVWSGFRLVREAARRGRSVIAINQGRTRADELLGFKLNQDCGCALEQLANSSESGSPSLG
ncbi:MAG: NAD-dependent protein deacetylase [Pseudomonadota bacterium]